MRGNQFPPESQVPDEPIVLLHREQAVEIFLCVSQRQKLNSKVYEISQAARRVSSRIVTPHVGKVQPCTALRLPRFFAHFPIAQIHDNQ